MFKVDLPEPGPMYTYTTCCECDKLRTINAELTRQLAVERASVDELARHSQDLAQELVEARKFQKLSAKSYDANVADYEALETERASLEADCDFANCRASECADELAEIEAQRDAAITAISEEGRKRGEVEAKLTALVESERESCAKIAEKYEPDEKQDYIMYASKEIRFRSNAAIKAAVDAAKVN